MALPTVSKRKGLRWCYLASAVFLLQTSQAFGIVDRLVYGEWAFKSGDKITTGLNLLMIVTSVLLFWRAKAIGASGILALALASFLLLSAVWSIDPETTVRRGIVYLFIIIGTIGVVGSLEGGEVMSLVGITCGLSAAASIVLLVISPSLAISPEALSNSDLRGIFAQKNGLGQVMAVGALASLSGIRISRGRKRLFEILTLILFIILAFFSKSTTALLMIFFFCTVGGVIALFQKGGIASILSVTSIILLVPVVGIVSLDTDIDTTLGLIGKDSTLTGRTELWSYLIYYIQQRPILGWGYSAFWSGNNPAVVEISTAMRWSVPQAHNAAIGILLEVGIVGLAFFLFLWVRNVASSVKCMCTSAKLNKELAVSSLLCCGGIFLSGITEPVLLEPGILLTVFFMTGLMCERAVRAGRRQRYPNYAAGSPAGFRSPTNALETNFRTRRAMHAFGRPIQDSSA